MDGSKGTIRRATFALLGVVSLLSGCAQLRLPAIDPTGDRLFLPCEQSTTLTGPQLPRIPAPAFKRPGPAPPASILGGPLQGQPITAPPAAAPCDPSATDPNAKGKLCRQLTDKSFGIALQDRVRHQLYRWGFCKPLVPRGQPGQIQLSPARVVAPVNSEVILVSGRCGPDGYLVNKQLVEWMLSNQSVGNIVAVGEPVHHHRRIQQVLPRQGCKLGVDYAINRTSSKDQILTRGTPSQRDDVLLQRGQAWLSVTSPTEGTTFATALLPEGDNWEQRRQTATIHWVDAKWAFPAPAAHQPIPAEGHELVTTVVRATDGLPQEGWIVRYEVSGGPPALLALPNQAPNTAVTTDVRAETDEQGRATALIYPQTGQPGTTTVQVQIFRPPLNGQPRLLVAEGTTTVAWNTAELRLRLTGPSGAVAAGADALYLVEVSNPGNLTADDVQLQVQLPPNLHLINAAPAPIQQLTTGQVVWSLGGLQGGRAMLIQMTCRGEQGDGKIFAKAVARNLEANGDLSISVVAPSLSAVMRRLTDDQQGVTDSEEADVGQLVPYEVQVTNTGNRPLNQVQITVEFPPALQERYGAASPISKLVPGRQGPGVLEPGESFTVGVTFQVLQPGRHCPQLRVTADGGHLASIEQCVAAAQPAPRMTPRMEVNKSGPPQASVGQMVEYTIDVVNTGDVPLVDLFVYDQFAASLEPRNATGNVSRPAADRLQWLLPRLDPGQAAHFAIQCQCVAADNAAVNRAEVVGTVEGTPVELREFKDVVTAIAPAGAPLTPPPGAPNPSNPNPPPNQPPPNQPPPGNAAEAGNLEVTLISFTNPAAIGQPVSFTVVLANRRNVGDQNVTLSISLPEGVEFQQPATGPTRVQLMQGGNLVYESIRELRPNESLENSAYRFTVVPRRAGQFTVRAVATSLRAPNGVATEKAMTVVTQ